MKERTERFVVLPFGLSCTSPSSVAVGATSQPEKQKPDSLHLPVPKGRQNEEVGPSKERGMKSSSSHGFPAFTTKPPNTAVASGILHKLRRCIVKSFTHMFSYKLEEEEEMEVEMEIGYPTDVKHVTHIGLDGSTHTNPVKEWQNLATPDVLAFPSISFRQFDLAAMASAAHTNDHQLRVAASGIY